MAREVVDSAEVDCKPELEEGDKVLDGGEEEEAAWVDRGCSAPDVG